MGGSAIYLGVIGIAASFLPQEILVALGASSETPLPLLVQLSGAAMFGFAMVNWMARGSLIGGIYNRPVAVGNVAHFVIGALALLKASGSMGATSPLLVLLIGHGLFAVAFSWMLMKSPVARAS